MSLRVRGKCADVATVIEMAMSRDPRSRPSAGEFGDVLRQIQARHGLVPDEMAFHSDMQSDPPPQQLAGSTAARDTLSNLPAEVTSFVGRRAELADVKNLLVTYRLVTLTGIGGVGKTCLALQAARDSAEDFVDGVRLVELGELRDGSLLADVVAEALSLRDDVSSPLTTSFDMCRARVAMALGTTWSRLPLALRCQTPRSRLRLRLRTVVASSSFTSSYPTTFGETKGNHSAPSWPHRDYTRNHGVTIAHARCADGHRSAAEIATKLCASRGTRPVLVTTVRSTSCVDWVGSSSQTRIASRTMSAVPPLIA